MQVETNVRAGTRDLELLITTEHDGYVVKAGVHRRTHARRQGGVRFVTQGSVNELAHLAHGMSGKCAAAGVAVDGMKALVICPDGIPDSFAARASILRSHMLQAIEVDPGMVYGPDMGCPEAVLDHVADDERLLANLTGLSRAHGGIDIDANALTALGVFKSLEAVGARLPDCRVGVQGFGADGAPLANMLHQAGARIVAVSNIAGTLIDDAGLDAATLYANWQRYGDACLIRHARGGEGMFHPDPNHLFTVAMDILVPAARTSTMSLECERAELREENPDVLAIEEFLSRHRPGIIAEAANHPLSYAAERYAEGCGVMVLPDIIINCGGMIGCWYEYEHRAALLDGTMGYDAALDSCRRIIAERIAANLTAVEGGAEQLRMRALRRFDPSV